jgi:hypothetical protein
MGNFGQPDQRMECLSLDPDDYSFVKPSILAFIARDRTFPAVKPVLSSQFA